MTATATATNRVPVGIGQLAVSKDPADLLVAYGLGSCVGVAVIDGSSRVCGMLHVLLPTSDGKLADEKEPGRYADLGVDALLARMTAAGASRARLVVKIAGGASVLGQGNAEKFKIGQRNAEAVKERLKRHGLLPAAEELGGTSGRTFELHVGAGKAFVRTATTPSREI